MNPIMLVTADKDLVRVVKAALHDTTARVVVETSSHRAAADALAQQPSMLVILDLFLPGSSGLEALTALKRVNESGAFVLLTRIRTRTHIERAFRLGAQDVLHWPVSTDVLRDTVLHRLEELPLAEADDEPEEGSPKTARKR